MAKTHMRKKTEQPWEVGARVQTRGNKDLSQDRNKD